MNLHLCYNDDAMDIQDQPITNTKENNNGRANIPERLLDTEKVIDASMRTGWTDADGLPLLPDQQPIGTVRDSLYDLIPLGPREEKLISTSEFLRLQQVKQLGFV